MTPLEMAMKLASASASCEKHKCPFMSKCKGDYATCVMKEIALMLRSQNAEIESLNALVKSYRSTIETNQTYVAELEKINKRYHDLVVAFQNGYRPKAKRYNPKRVPSKKKIDPIDMDGKECYAQEPPPKTEPRNKLVVI